MNTLTTIHPEFLAMSREQLLALSPYLWVFGGTVIALLLSVVRLVPAKWLVFPVSLMVAITGMALAGRGLGAGGQTLFNGMLAVDAYSGFFNILFLGLAALTLLVSFRYLDKEGLQHGEYYVLVLFSTLGMMLLGSALDLIVIFISLELMSLAIYVLVGFRRADRRSNEAAVKYFILGSAASAILLYGAALLYGSTQSLNLREILAVIQAQPRAATPVFALGALLVVSGFLFKVASVPFHVWMPDVYEGAPTPVTGFMATGLKAAAFAVLIRVFIATGYGKGLAEVVQGRIHDILWASAALTMVAGNVIALTQTNLKRMLAYSSIAHSGYLLVGLIAGPQSEQGYAPIAVYLVAYAIMNLGAFSILAIIASRGDGGTNLHDVSGLARRHPWLAFSMAIFLFSMAGIPPTAGFVAKYLLFYSAIQAGEVVLVVIGVLCSAISVYYYLRVLVHMYMRDPAGVTPAARVPAWSAIVVAAMVVLTLQIGVLPARMVAAAKKAMTSL